MEQPHVSKVKSDQRGGIVDQTQPPTPTPTPATETDELKRIAVDDRRRGGWGRFGCLQTGNSFGPQPHELRCTRRVTDRYRVRVLSSGSDTTGACSVRPPAQKPARFAGNFFFFFITTCTALHGFSCCCTSGLSTVLQWPATALPVGMNYCQN